MSNALRYDALLVRDLAADLDRRLAGARLDGAWLERDSLRVALRTRSDRRSRDAPPSLLWQLHPTSGHLTTGGADTVTGGQLQLGAPARILRVSAPPDERIVDIELDAGTAAAGVVRRIVIELITNQWNAVAIGADDRILAVLRERATKDRALRAGVVYQPPRSSGRIGACTAVTEDQWLEVLEPVPPGERLRAMLQFAWTSPLNAPAILGRADVTPDRDALLQAFARYDAMLQRAAPVPVLVRLEDAWQPYTLWLEEAEPAASLLDAFDRAAERSAAAPTAGATAEHALQVIAERLDAAARRIDRLRAEHAGAAQDAEGLRHRAGLLLAQLHRVPRGAATADLDDFAGGMLTVSLDATQSAAENARTMYDAARKRDRAAARVPRLIAAAEQDIARLESLAARVREGTAGTDELEQLRRARVTATTARDDAPALPYREYRTSGGLDVRVGRGSKANDALTFRHSSPTDIWLHARDVAGAHVILRWPHRSSNPAARDIEEAAVLAALFSRARTSGLVPVDWTRRRHVRKPRKAPPGLVLPEQVRTVFVTPDAELEERLRVDAGF